MSENFPFKAAALSPARIARAKMLIISSAVTFRGYDRIFSMSTPAPIEKAAGWRVCGLPAPDGVLHNLGKGSEGS
jgi:hypothetical protein